VVTITRLDAAFTGDLALDLDVAGVRETVTASAASPLWLDDGSLAAAVVALAATHASAPSVAWSLVGDVVTLAAAGLTVHGGTALAAALGYDDAPVLTGRQTATRATPLRWRPGGEPSLDTGPRARPLVGRLETWGGLVAATDWGAAARSRACTWPLIAAPLAVTESRTTAATCFEDWRAAASVAPLRAFDAAGALLGTYRLRGEPMLERDPQWVYRWQVTLDLAEATA
jgi:hypothetical protein